MWCLTGAEAAASSGVLPPSTRAFGRVPLTGEVDKPRRKERAPVAPEEDAYEQSADQQIRCQIDKICKAEGECRRLVEIQLDGRLLCVGHAGLLRLEECSETMLGEVFEMDQWLESVDGEADELGVRRAEHHRNELVEQLRLNQTRIGLFHDVLLSPRRGQGADERRRGARPRLRPGDVPHPPAADRELGDHGDRGARRSLRLVAAGREPPASGPVSGGSRTFEG
jgi:hypothetical protein